MAPHKCSYLVFTNSNANLSDELNLNLNGSKLKYDNNPTFLGIRFDNHLTFKNQVEYLKETCIQRLNILKILSHKSWMLTVKTLLQIYNVLIRSIIDYSSIIAPIISATNLNVLQIIQNKALRIIYKKSLFTRTSNEWLHEQASLCTIKDRLKLLRKRYMEEFYRWIRYSVISGKILFNRIIYINICFIIKINLLIIIKKFRCFKLYVCYFYCWFLLKVRRLKKMLTLGEIAVENIHLFRTRGFFFNLFVFSEPKLKLLLKLITKQLISLCYFKFF